MIDYYRVLAVHSSADFATIKSAYLKKAVSCHPDRGGSHKAMLLVNKAWDVLSNPGKRSRYDRALARARQRATEEARKPKEETVQGFSFYNFWKRDFVNAGFHKNEAAWYEIPFSLESISGLVFVVLGVVAGWYALPWLFSTTESSSWIRAPLIFVYGSIGARTGAMFHRIVATNCGFFG